MATKEEALKALKAIAEASTVDRRLTGTIISSKGRHVTVALDGESVSVSAYRGAFEPSVGVRVTIERVAGMSVYRVVGVADDSLIANDQNVNDYEYRGTLLYYPLALEAVNDAAYNLGNELEITLYNVQAIDSDSNFVYVENETLDLSASVPFADSRWAIIYLNLTDSTLDVYNHPSTATPVGEWVDAVNGMLSTVAEAVPVLAVRLDVGMEAWTDAYRVIRRGYLFGSKRIIRIPVPMQPNIGTVITDAYYQVVQDNGADKVSRANLNFADSSTVTVSVTDDGLATTSVVFEAVSMVGADAVTDGAAGIVPQPLMGDEGKYLRGDGTWQLPTSPLTVTDETVTVTPTNTLTVDPDDFEVTDEGGGVAKLKFIGTAEAAFSVTDGTTTVDPVSEIEFSSAFEVTDGDDGIAQIGLANTPVYSFGISGDSGSGTITDGETLGHVGGSGIATDVSGNNVTTALNINGLTEEPSIAAGDKIPYYDVSASANRYIKYSDLGITATDADAIHDNVAGEINAIAEKTTPVDDDVLLIEDSAASYAKKRVKIGNLPSGGGGGAIAVEQSGSTAITGVDHLVYKGATITNLGGGVVEIKTSGGAYASPSNPTLRGTASASATSTQPAVTIPAGTQEGDIIVIYAMGNFSMSTPSGWVLVSAATANNQNTAIYMKIASATDAGTSVTVTFSGSAAARHIYCASVSAYAGFVYFYTNSSGATAVTSRSVSYTTPNNALVVWAGSSRTTSVALTALPSSATVERTVVVGDNTGALFSKAYTTSATESFGFNSASASACLALMAFAGSTGYVHAARLPVSTYSVSNPPTDAELDAAYGTPAAVGSGFTSILDDNGAGSDVYTVASDGTNWWYTPLTKAL